LPAGVLTGSVSHAGARTGRRAGMTRRHPSSDVCARCIPPRTLQRMRPRTISAAAVPRSPLTPHDWLRSGAGRCGRRLVPGPGIERGCPSHGGGFQVGSQGATDQRIADSFPYSFSISEDCTPSQAPRVYREPPTLPLAGPKGYRHEHRPRLSCPLTGPRCQDRGRVDIVSGGESDPVTTGVPPPSSATSEVARMRARGAGTREAS
jgi:hypothetical protein